jgi:PleD family two-component response regulator
VILDPVGGPDEALTVANRIRDQILELAADLPPEVHFGVSIGVALSDLDDTPSTLLNRADNTLYVAKARHDSSIELDGDRALAAS